MKRIILLTVGLFLFAGWGTSAPQATKTPPRAKARQAAATSSQSQTSTRHVLIVSVDGLMPESYTAPDKHGLKVPTLREIVEHGATSGGVRGVMPAVTYPSHTMIDIAPTVAQWLGLRLEKAEGTALAVPRGPSETKVKQ